MSWILKQVLIFHYRKSNIILKLWTANGGWENPWIEEENKGELNFSREEPRERSKKKKKPLGQSPKAYGLYTGK